MSGPLLPHHAELLRASAISDEVAAARGYFSAETKTALAELGFETYQRIVPALVLPCWGVDGAIVNYQARPDRPRIDRERGREIKYETVAGSTTTIDAPPCCRAMLGSTRIPLWITEGLRKGDSLASRGLCVVSLLGVWAFDSVDWERVALDERRVYVVFDSDVMRKPSVYKALVALANYLAAKGAIVHFVYLLEDEGKVGVDDFLAAGHTLDELYALAVDELPAPPPEPAPERPAAWPTMLLLDSVERYLRRLVRFPSRQEVTALVLFVAHTWVIEAAQATPYLLVISPELRAGKTRVLETMELVVREPLRAVDITAAAVFQAIEAWHPTLLVDEIDAIWKARSDQAEAVRSVLNSGNRRGAYVVRGTPEGEPVKFSTWSPKMLAGIANGHLPDTIRDRAIVLRIERLRQDEHVDDLFPIDLAEPTAKLRELFENWAAHKVEALTQWRRSERIPGVDARLQEAWDPLLAIAEDAGGDWPARARAAAMGLAKGRAEDAQTHGHVLLVALREIFKTETSPLASKTICTALNEDEELPFGGWSEGRGIAPRDLAKLLRPYGIKPRNVRQAGWTGTAKGYHAEQFDEAWARYAAEEDARAAEPSGEAAQAAQAAHPPVHRGFDVPDVPDVPAQVDANGTEIRLYDGDVPDVPDVPDICGPSPRVPLFDAPAGGDPSSNGQVDDDYAERFRQRQAEGAWGIGP